MPQYLCSCNFFQVPRIQHMHHMAPTDINMVNVLEQCRVAPPPGTVAEKSLLLTFFDLPWLCFPPLVQRLLFYEFPHPKTHFTEIIIPTLKNSATLTLKHFFPLAGKLIIPSNYNKPEIRYVDGDSVSLTFAESSNDFNYLTGNHERNAHEFYHLVPQMPQVVTDVSGTIVAPLLALQVTLFPNFGICFGVTYNHATADGRTLINFLRSWASIAKFGGEAALLAGGSIPFYDRTVIKDPNRLETIFWSQVGKIKFEGWKLQYPPTTTQVRATFVITRADVQRLKKLVPARRTTLVHVSTFTVTCAYVWICVVKSRAASGEEEEVDEDELEHLVCPADYRSRLNPPIPATYFGNCLAPCIATAKNTQLMREGGFSTAAELIGEAISKRLHNEEGVLKGSETWISDLKGLNWERVVGVSGSPKLGFYNMDFGWGRPKKGEVISIDTTGSISLSECRDSEGDLEVGLSFPKIKMDAFATIFATGLKIL